MSRSGQRGGNEEHNREKPRERCYGARTAAAEQCRPGRERRTSKKGMQETSAATQQREPYGGAEPNQNSPAAREEGEGRERAIMQTAVSLASSAINHAQYASASKPNRAARRQQRRRNAKPDMFARQRNQALTKTSQAMRRPNQRVVRDKPSVNARK